jgi:NAD(P)-dependent dehydrogenase (short-subunit alcohol dehydrogenase family)
MTSSLDGRRIVLTGAGSGIGLATARLLAQHGARLALIARSRDGLEAAASAVTTAGYVAAKHAVRGFLGSLRVEQRNRSSRVEVCMVHPGFIGTPSSTTHQRAVDAPASPAPGVPSGGRRRGGPRLCPTSPRRGQRRRKRDGVRPRHPARAAALGSPARELRGRRSAPSGARREARDPVGAVRPRRDHRLRARTSQRMDGRPSRRRSPARCRRLRASLASGGPARPLSLRLARRPSRTGRVMPCR